MSATCHIVETTALDLSQPIESIVANMLPHSNTTPCVSEHANDDEKDHGGSNETGSWFTCAHCDNSFADAGYFQRHKQKCCRGRVTQHQCPICHKYLCDVYSVKRHLDSVHYAIKQHKCTQCHKKFTKSETLKVHIFSVHLGHKYQCHICDTTLISKANLDRHIFLHSGAKPRVCTLCGLCFANSDQLRGHNRRSHEQSAPIKRFRCDLCDKAFATRNTVTRHLFNIHSRNLVPGV